jgi:hypothetical protein
MSNKNKYKNEAICILQSIIDRINKDEDVKDMFYNEERPSSQSIPDRDGIVVETCGKKSYISIKIILKKK